MSTESPLATPLPQTVSEESPDTRATLDLLVGHENQPDTDTPTNGDRVRQHQNHHRHHQHHHHHHHHDNHKKKRSSQSSHSEEA